MGNRIYVGNLAFTTTVESLRDAISALGFTPKDVHIVHDRESGRSRGFGFVEFTSDDEAVKAIQSLDGKDVDGRALRVNEAQARAPRPGGGGGGGRGGGRGGRGGDDVGSGGREGSYDGGRVGGRDGGRGGGRGGHGGRGGGRDDDDRW